MSSCTNAPHDTFLFSFLSTSFKQNPATPGKVSLHQCTESYKFPAMFNLRNFQRTPRTSSLVRLLLLLLFFPCEFTGYVRITNRHGEHAPSLPNPGDGDGDCFCNVVLAGKKHNSSSTSAEGRISAFSMLPVAPALVPIRLPCSQWRL